MDDHHHKLRDSIVAGMILGAICYVLIILIGLGTVLWRWALHG